LKSAYIIKCEAVIKDNEGSVTELRCTYIPESKSGQDTSGVYVKGVIHWVNAATALPIEVRLYDRLFKVEDLSTLEDDFRGYVNTDSLKAVRALAEPSLQGANGSDRFQFLRMGYFCLDKDSTREKLVFNRTVTLKDLWAKEQKK
ncbi:MAG: glutamine--tRNA ligase, partial [Cytophagales bacterium]